MYHSGDDDAQPDRLDVVHHKVFDFSVTALKEGGERASSVSSDVQACEGSIDGGTSKKKKKM